MPFDPSGNFTRVHNWQEDRDNGIRILADRHDEEDDNFADGFNQVFLRTGTVPMTGNLVMNGYKVTSIGAGSETVPSLTWELSNNTGWWQPSPNALAVSTQGTKRLEVNNDGIHVFGSTIIDGQLLVSGSINVPILSGDIRTGPVAGGAVHILELGALRTVDGETVVDFHTSVSSDFDARISRWPGLNGKLQTIQIGTGAISWEHTGAERMSLSDYGLRLDGWNPQLHLYTSRARGAGGVGFDMHDASGAKGWVGFVGTDDTFHINNNLNSAMYFYTNNAARMWIASDGVVTAPSGFNTGIVRSPSVEFPDDYTGSVVRALVYRDGNNFIVSTNRAVPGSERYWTFNANGQIYDSIGALYWNSGNDGHGSGLDADTLDGLHAGNFQGNLGFTPVQQGGGAGQGTNKIYFGWGTSGGLRVTVDSTDQGPIAMVMAPNTFTAGQAAPSFTGDTINGSNYVWGNNQLLTNGVVSATAEITSTGAGAMLRWNMRDNAGITNGWYGTAGFSRMWRSDIGDTYEVHPTAFRTPGDQVADCGGPSQRWFTVWCRTSAMATSDLREKDWRGGLNATELLVAKALASKIGIYRWLTDIEKDGDGAKLSCGFAAQHVIALFEEHGLNALDYAFIRYDEWDEYTSNGPLIGDAPEPVLLDEERDIWDRRDNREMSVITHPAGNRYSIMLADLIAFMMVGQEQRLAALEAV
jgi:hypothetical protein